MNSISDKVRFEEFERDGYVILRNFWQCGELDELQNQLDELGKLVWARNSRRRIRVGMSLRRRINRSCMIGLNIFPHSR